MAQRGTALAVRNETWPEYLQRVTGGVSRKDVAAAAAIDISGVSRWLTGTTSRPKAETVVAFARGLGLNPVEALVAAGYLNSTEVQGVVEVVRTRSELSDDELVAEVAVRLADARSARSVPTDGDKAKQLPRGGRIIRKTAPRKNPPVSGNQKRSQGH